MANPVNYSTSRHTYASLSLAEAYAGRVLLRPVKYQAICYIDNCKWESSIVTEREATKRAEAHIEENHQEVQV